MKIEDKIEGTFLSMVTRFEINFNNSQDLKEEIKGLKKTQEESREFLEQEIRK